jgi:cathepsin L
MKLSLMCLLGLVSLSQAVSFFELVLDEWETFKAVHVKKYGTEMEDKFRMKIYMENKQKVEKHNAQAARGEHTYHLKMNMYGDMLHHEFVATMNGYKQRPKNDSSRPVGATYLMPAHVDKLPLNVDWRKHGAVTPVKNQGQCGSCWSFSTTGALEAQHYRKTGKLTSLSEQNLVDCSRSYGNNGCNGGLMDNAFQYIKDNGGIDTEESYPYEGEDDQCRYNPKNKGAWDVGFVDVTEGDEVALKNAIATVGPCSVAIDASHESFQFYSHGVYRDPECTPQDIDHGVLAVGYGVDETGQAYWLVKNSWGTTWGDQGYVKMARNEDNMCGIASSASYPLV